MGLEDRGAPAGTPRAPPVRADTDREGGLGPLWLGLGGLRLLKVGISRIQGRLGLRGSRF